MKKSEHLLNPNLNSFFRGGGGGYGGEGVIMLET